MANRKTGLDVSVFTLLGGTYLGDVRNFEVSKRNKTEEGKGIADIDDFPVLVGSMWEAQCELLVAGTTTMALMGTAASNVPAGTVGISTGGAAYAGTAVITEARHRGEREGIQVLSVTMLGRGNIAVT